MQYRLALLLLLGLATAASAEQRLRLHGSNTVGESLAPALAAAWLRDEGFVNVEQRDTAFEEVEVRGERADETRVVEIHAHGSSTGFADLAAGSADIAMASRAVKPDEIAANARFARLDRVPQEVVLALDGLAVIVQPDSPLRTLSKTQIRDLFSGRITDWSKIDARLHGAVRLHARDDRSGTYDTFRSLVLGEQTLSASAKRYESTEQLAREVAHDPQAIGFVGLSGVHGVRALAVSDGGAALVPSLNEVAVEDYPLSRRLYLYLPSEAPALAREFADFATAADGQSVVERTGFVSQAIRGYAQSPREDAPAQYHQFVAGAERLSLNFRFGEGSRLLDSKTALDLDRLAAFMREPQNQKRPLILLGFSDAVESVPAMALFLSAERADYIADLLVQRGVDPSRVRGLGDAVPVAANDSVIGRQRNRRVEVWLGATSQQLAMHSVR